MTHTPSRPALGEVLQKRHPVLIALVFLFAIALAVYPYFFHLERNLLTEAVEAYDSVCRAARAHDLGTLKGLLAETREDGHVPDSLVEKVRKALDCIPRDQLRPGIEVLKNRGPGRFFVLSFVDRDTVKARVWMWQYENRITLAPLGMWAESHARKAPASK